MRVSLIEIGSNAVRHHRANVNSKFFVLDEKTRYPIRLGSEVFNTGKISKESIFELKCIFSKIFYINSIEKNNENLVIATSALREAKNKKEIIKLIKEVSDYDIQIIPGSTEAQLVQVSALTNQLNINKLSLLIDMGGGSTEFILCKKEEIITTKSFPLGTLKYLSLKNESKILDKIKNDMKEIKDYLIDSLEGKKIHHIYGIGGNARRIGKLNKHFSYSNRTDYVERKNLSKMIRKIKDHSFLDRIKLLGLRKDRADVIIPASFFFLEVLKTLDLKSINLPEMTIADSIFHLLISGEKVEGLTLNI